MKITSVDCMIIDSGDPCKGRNTWHPIVIRVNTDEGICGFGEAGVAYGRGFRAAFGMVQDFSEIIIGEDPMNIEKNLGKDLPQDLLGSGWRHHHQCRYERH